MNWFGIINMKWVDIEIFDKTFVGKYQINEDGEIRNTNTGRLMIGGISRGYRHVGLYDSFGKRRRIQVHRIVALTFLGDRPTDSHQIDHIDGNKLNNCASNLRYLTASENVRHSYALGRVGYKKPEKLSKKDASKIRHRIESGDMQKDIAIDFGISQAMVSKIKKGERWAK